MSDDAAFARAIFTLLLGMAGFLTLGLIAQLLHPGWGIWFTEVVVFLGVPFALLRTAGKAPLTAATLGRPWASGMVWGFAFGVVNFFALAVPLMWLSRQAMPQQVLELFDSSKIFQDQRPVDLTLLVLGICFAAPLCEEFFFRGVVQPGLMRHVRPERAVMLCAFIFSAFHLDPVGLLARFELGVVFGLMAWRSGSLWPGICAHAANNIVSSVSFFATRTQSEDALAWWVPLSMLMAGSFGLFVLVRVARVRPSILRSPVGPPQPDAAPAGILRAGAPWFLGGLMSFLALIAVDFKAVATNAVDAFTPATVPGRVDPTPEEEAQLKEWRAAARAGELSIKDYARQRDALTRTVRERRRAPDDQVKR